MSDLSVLQRQLLDQRAHLSPAKSVLEQGGEEKSEIKDSIPRFDFQIEILLIE